MGSLLPQISYISAPITSAPSIQSPYEAGEALTAGAAVYIAADSSVPGAEALVMKTIATSETVSRFVGVASAAQIVGGIVNVRTEGVASVEVDAGTYAAGEPLFLSSTAGRATRVLPVTDMLVRIGYSVESGVKAAGGVLRLQLVSHQRVNLVNGS